MCLMLGILYVILVTEVEHISSIFALCESDENLHDLLFSSCFIV